MEDIYPEGMLDRDQRTAKIRLCQCGDIIKVPKRTRNSFTTNSRTRYSSIISNILSINKKTNLLCNKGYLAHSLSRLKHVLLVLVYLTLLNLPATKTAPLETMSTGWWNNICDKGLEIPDRDAVPENFQTWNLEILINQVYITRSDANDSKDGYAQKTFSKSFDELFVDGFQEWLPRLPKQYREQVPENVLKSKTPAELLKEIYRNLQIYGVGIDIAANEESIQNSPDYFFRLKREELKSLLCEFNTFLITVKILPSFDVTEEIIPAEFKNLDTTRSDMRNYIMYKEYLNCLEYLDQTLKYFKALQQGNK